MIDNKEGERNNGKWTSEPPPLKDGIVPYTRLNPDVLNMTTNDGSRRQDKES